MTLATTAFRRSQVAANNTAKRLRETTRSALCIAGALLVLVLGAALAVVIDIGVHKMFDSLLSLFM